MTTHKLKRYMMPLFVFFIMLAGAKAADYLWEPKLLWESKESYEQSIGGLQFINDDSHVLYCADGKLYVRDAQTGEILKQSTDAHLFTGIMNLSENKMNIYAIVRNSDYSNSILSFDFETMKLIDSALVPSFSKTIDEHSTFYTTGFADFIFGLKAIYQPNAKKNTIVLKGSGQNNLSGATFSGYCLISFDAKLKISEMKPTDWKMEYYFETSNRANIYPTLSKDNKYLIYETGTDVKIIDLETMKEYWTIPNENIEAITPNSKFVLSIHTPGLFKIFNIADKSEMFSLDSKALLESSNFKSNVTYKTNDPLKIFYGGSGYPYFDCSDKTVKYIFDPALNMGIRYCDEKTTKFLAGIYNDLSNTIHMYFTNPTAGIGDHSADDKPEYLTISNNKLIIPIYEIVPKEISIFNADGKLIKQFTTFDADKENIYLNISFLNQGVYFVSVISENGNRTNYKFLKGE